MMITFTQQYEKRYEERDRYRTLHCSVLLGIKWGGGRIKKLIILHKTDVLICDILTELAKKPRSSYQSTQRRAIQTSQHTAALPAVQPQAAQDGAAHHSDVPGQNRSSGCELTSAQPGLSQLSNTRENDDSILTAVPTEFNMRPFSGLKENFSFQVSTTLLARDVINDTLLLKNQNSKVCIVNFSQLLADQRGKHSALPSSYFTRFTRCYHTHLLRPGRRTAASPHLSRRHPAPSRRHAAAGPAPPRREASTRLPDRCPAARPPHEKGTGERRRPRRRLLLASRPPPRPPPVAAPQPTHTRVNSRPASSGCSDQ